MAKKNNVKKEDDALTQYTFEEEKPLNLPQTGLVLTWTDPLGEKDAYV